MKAEITINQLYWNPSLMNFFFRTQAKNTLNELLDKATDRQNALDSIEGYAESTDTDVDSLEEMFYEMTVEELAAEICIELDEEEEEEDEDE